MAQFIGRIPKLLITLISHCYKRRGKFGGGAYLALTGAGVIQLGDFWPWIGWGVIIIGALVVLYSIFWRHHDDIDSLEDCYKNSKVTWGMWWAGGTVLSNNIIQEHGKSLKRILLLDPANNKNNFNYIVARSNCPTALCEILALTKLAIERNIEVKWHTEPSGYSFTIWDSKAQETGDKVEWSKRAYLAVKFLEPQYRKERRQLSVRRKSSESNEFQYYVNEFSRIWDTNSRSISKDYVEALCKKIDLA